MVSKGITEKEKKWKILNNTFLGHLKFFSLKNAITYIGSLPDSEKGLNFEKNEIFVKNILFNRKNDVNNTFNFLCFQKEKNNDEFFSSYFFSLFNQSNDNSYIL